LVSCLNSKSLKISRSTSSFGGCLSKVVSSKVTGTSKIMVANCFDKIACCALSLIFSPSLPFTLSALSKTFSSVPYSCNNLAAVFSPTPGMPGILSAASPIKPKISITCEISLMSNFFKMPSIPTTSGGLPNTAGLYILIFSVTNWP